MNSFYYIKSKNNDHKIFLKTNNENIHFECKDIFEYQNFNNIISKYQINCYNNKIFETKENEDKFNKQKNILENQPFEYLNDDEQDKIFEVNKYEINNFKYIINLDEPTLCLSLFSPDINKMKNNPINNPKIIEFFNKLIYTQIKLLLSFRFYFPSSNIILYLDQNLINFFEIVDNEIQSYLSYLLNRIFRSKLFYLFKNINTELNNFIQLVFKKLKEYKYYNFDNFLNKYLFFINFICSMKNDSLQISDSVSELFLNNYSIIYGYNFIKLNNIEYTEYVGQLIRYLPLTIKQNRYKHLIWRDPHHVIIRQTEFEWIRSFNNLGKTNNAEIYLLPITYDYCRPWHDIIKSEIDNKYYQYSIIAGTMIQMCNFTNSDSFLDKINYIQTIGLPFLLDKNNELILYKNCPLLYNYGLDEYILSSFLSIKSIKNKSIYTKNVNIDNILNITLEYYNEISISYMILFLYLYDNHSLLIYTDNFIKKTTLINFINSIEILRKCLFSINTKYFNKILILLSIVPTIYNIHEINAEDYNNELINGGERVIDVDLMVENILNIFNELYDIKIDINNLYKLYSSKKILSKLNINWATTIINTSLEWNTYPYFKNIKNKNYNFYAGLYLPGTYIFKLPFNISILRSPADLKHSYFVLKKFKTLENTEYKLQNIELTNTIKNKLNNNIFENINKGIIKKEIISKILDINISEIKQKTYSKIIWRILLYNNYNIPIEFVRFRKKFKRDIISSYDINRITLNNLNKKNIIINKLFNNKTI